MSLYWDTNRRSLTFYLLVLLQTHVVTSSMGLQPEKPDPEQYLRRGTRKDKDRALLPSVEHQTRNREVIKPHLPPVDEKPMQKPPTTKDYVNSNAVEIINSSPKRKEVEIPYNKSLDYGKVPAYLEAVKTEIQKEKMLVETYVIPQTTQERIMDEQERRELIDKLKKRWDDVNAEYSKYCHKVILDTPGEIKRKVSQEAELQQLEDDIQRLSHLGPLVVVEELAVRDKK